uniref:Uncharacterized protein n=1 Tax=viral metagenome TaxID=1070528 RepID=A0A6M3L870_9ZZZZ
MSKSGQAFVAATEGHSFTMYAVMKLMGIPLSEEQEEFQAYLERTYPAVVEKEDTYTEVLAEDYGSGGNSEE